MRGEILVINEGIIADSAQRWKLTNAAMEKMCPKLGAIGWTIPPYFTAREIIQIVIDTKLNPSKLDKFFVEYYSASNNAYFKQELSTLPTYILQPNLFREYVQTYLAGYYLVTIPSLLLMIEGIFSGLVNSSKKLYIINFCEKETSIAESGSIKRIAWSSITEFIKCLFGSIPFDKNRPELINRHWILHGRDADNWQQSDALRLFHAISTLGLVIREDLKTSTK